MAILITNDDGIEAPGIAELVNALKGLDELFVAAPATNRSGVGMAITLGQDIALRTYESGPGGAKAISVGGTPADAVKYALQKWLKTPPALVVSGINPGPNLGQNVRCSGTLGAAFEALVAGIPAVAVSTAHTEPQVWEGAKHYARLVVRRALDLAKKQKDFVLNLNVPATSAGELPGLKLTRHGMGGYIEQVMPTSSLDSFGIHGVYIDIPPEEKCDGAGYTAGYAVLTPLRFDMTHHELMTSLGNDWNDLWAI